jgi:hypothetical protein
MFLGEKLMLILADFRKNGPCGDSLVTRIYRKNLRPKLLNGSKQKAVSVMLTALRFSCDSE